MAERISIQDLLSAAEWCEEGYELTKPDDPTDVAMAHSIWRVGRWLAEEARKRQEDAVLREIMKKHGVSRKSAIAILNKVMENRAVAAAAEQNQPPQPDPYLESISKRNES